MKEKILAQLKSKYSDLGLSAETLERVAGLLAISVQEESQIESLVNNEQTLATLKGFESEIGKRVSKFKKQAEDLQVEIGKLKGGGTKTIAELEAEIEALKKADPNDAKVAELEKQIGELRKPKNMSPEEIAKLVSENSSKEINDLKTKMDAILNKDKIATIRKNVWAKFVKDDIENESLTDTYKTLIFNKLGDFEDEESMYEELKKQVNEFDVTISKSGFVPSEGTPFGGAKGNSTKDFAAKQREKKYGKKK